jgi:hypothetical protein
MSNVVSLFDELMMLICGCNNDKYFVNYSHHNKLTLVCTECLHGIEGYKVIKDESANG